MFLLIFALILYPPLQLRVQARQKKNGPIDIINYLHYRPTWGPFVDNLNMRVLQIDGRTPLQRQGKAVKRRKFIAHIIEL